MLRFKVLVYEPYITFLNNLNLTYEIFFFDIRNLYFKNLVERVFDKVKEKYKGENIDYIEFLVNERLEEIIREVIPELSNTNSIRENVCINLEIYTQIIEKSLKKLTSLLIKNNQIVSLEDFKFISQYVEPTILFLKYFLEKGNSHYIINKKTDEVWEIFLDSDFPKIDIHVHAETSYNFYLLLEFIIRNFVQIKRYIVKYKHRYKNKRELSEKLKKLSFLIDVYDHLRRNKNISFSQIYSLVNAPIYISTPNIYILKTFRYVECVLCLLKHIRNISNPLNSFASVLALQIINDLNSDLLFSGEFKGLKQMGVNFSNVLKKIYQSTRARVVKHKDLLFKGDDKYYKNFDYVIYETYKYYDTDFSHKSNLNYIETRLSTDKNQLKYWYENTIKFDNVYFILHYKKIKSSDEFTNYKKLKNFVRNLRKETQSLFHFFKKMWYHQISNVIIKNGKCILIPSYDIVFKIVGFDAASIEYWTPPWIYRIFFAFWKNVFRILYPEVYKNKFILTFHAGEDFVDLATGLKMVYESIYFLNVNRLGHAMSLGVNVEKYLMRYKKVPIHPVIYFYHLLWLHHMTFKYEKLKKYHNNILMVISNFIEKYNLKDIIYKALYSKKLSCIWPEDLSLFLEKLYKTLGFFYFEYENCLAGKEDAGEFLKFLYKAYTSIFKEEDINLYMLRDRILGNIHECIYKTYKFSYGKLANEYFSPLLSNEDILSEDNQVEFIKDLQRVVIDIVRKNNIIIESCPSSNVILYNISSFEDHPLLCSREKSNLLTINTDNPLLLNTNILLEFNIVKEVYKDKEFINCLLENNEKQKIENIRKSYVKVFS